MNPRTNLSQVQGEPYEPATALNLWLLFIEDLSLPLPNLIEALCRVVAPQPCTASLRVYSDSPEASHVQPLNSGSAALALLKDCEAVGVFHSADFAQDRQAIVDQLRHGAEDDEACLIQAVYPRPVLFLHAGHPNIDLVCTREDADRVLNYLNRRLA